MTKIKTADVFSTHLEKQVKCISIQGMKKCSLVTGQNL